MNILIFIIHIFIIFYGVYFLLNRVREYLKKSHKGYIFYWILFFLMLGVFTYFSYNPLYILYLNIIDNIDFSILLSNSSLVTLLFLPVVLAVFGIGIMSNSLFGFIDSVIYKNKDISKISLL